MKKKLLIIFIIITLVAIVLTGCSPESKAKAIPTDILSTDTVSSNGGLAVSYGKYIYYINGFAGAEAANEYGEALKGAICRVEVDANGIVVPSTNVVIVPKNAYGTDTKSGLYISNGYIYFSTPNDARDGKGVVKTKEMNLMRTRLDGTGTVKIKSFDDFTPVYSVTDNHIMYVLGGELFSIDLNAKSFKETKITDKIVAFMYGPRENAFRNNIFFAKANPIETEYSNVIYSYVAGAKEPTVVIDKAKYASDTAMHINGYQLTLVQLIAEGNNLRMVYNKTDGGPNKTSVGTYSHVFDATLTFKFENELRHIVGDTYTSLYFVDSATIFAIHASRIELITTQVRATVVPKAAGILKIEKIENGFTIYYTESAKISKHNIVIDSDNKVTFNGVESLFSGSANTTYTAPELIGKNYFFFNSAVKDNMYYIDITSIIPRKADTSIPKLLGKMTNADEIACL